MVWRFGLALGSDMRTKIRCIHGNLVSKLGLIIFFEQTEE